MQRFQVEELFAYLRKWVPSLQVCMQAVESLMKMMSLAIVKLIARTRNATLICLDFCVFCDRGFQVPTQFYHCTSSRCFATHFFRFTAQTLFCHCAFMRFYRNQFVDRISLRTRDACMLCADLASTNLKSKSQVEYKLRILLSQCLVSYDLVQLGGHRYQTINSLYFRF